MTNPILRRMLCALLLTLLPIPAGAASAEPLKTISCFINHSWYPVSSFSGIIPEEITRLTGVTLDVTIAKSPQQLS